MPRLGDWPPIDPLVEYLRPTPSRLGRCEHTDGRGRCRGYGFALQDPRQVLCLRHWPNGRDVELLRFDKLGDDAGA